MFLINQLENQRLGHGWPRGRSVSEVDLIDPGPESRFSSITADATMFDENVIALVCAPGNWRRSGFHLLRHILGIKVAKCCQR